MGRLLIVVVEAPAERALAPGSADSAAIAAARAAGAEVEVATLGGGEGVPIDAVDPLGYAALLLLGGEGAVAAARESRHLRTVIETIARHGIVASLGAGAAGLLPATAPDGQPFVAGRRLAPPGEAALEARLEALGARIEAAGGVVADGNLLSARDEDAQALASALAAALEG